MKTFQINTVFLKNPKCLFTPLTWHFKTTYIGSSAECLDKRFCDIGWLPLALNEFIKTTDTRGGKYISLMKIKTANEFYFSQHSKNSMFVISYTMQVLGWKLGRLGGIRRPFCSPDSITIFIPLGSSATAGQQFLPWVASARCAHGHPTEAGGNRDFQDLPQTVSSQPCLSRLRRERKDQALGFSLLSSSAVSLPSPPCPFLFFLSPTIIICLRYRSYRNFVFKSHETLLMV